MEISNSSLSLFNYIGDSEKSNEVLQGLANNSDKNVSAGLDVLETGLSSGKFEETLELMEKGEIDVDLNLVQNYYEFNQQKLNREVAQLARKFDLGAEIAVTLQDDKLVVDGDSDNAKALQNYLDKDTRLSSLVQQTAKLQQFVEWGQAKEQAAVYQSEDMPEEQLVEFLKDARLVMTQENYFLMSDKGSAFYSQGHTQNLIDNTAQETN
jgi:DNA-binding LytR/AlgR family response regulator